MKSLSPTISFTIILAAMTAVFAQESKSPKLEQANAPVKKSVAEKSAGKFIGFVDVDEDGVNDRFVDADGNGKNDVDGKEYSRRFQFQDENKDGINDLWVDQDGEGVNDLSPSLKGKDKKDVHRNVVDADDDGRNDVTGESYHAEKREWHGERWGFWDEKNGKIQGGLVDENANGIDDRTESQWHGKNSRHHGGDARDYFIDEDGDGICDGRGDVIRMMGRSSRGEHGQKKMGGHHRP